MLIDVSATGMTGQAFAWHVLEKVAVAVMPGSSFGTQAHGFIRMSLTVPDEQLVEACRRITDVVNRFARSANAEICA